MGQQVLTITTPLPAQDPAARAGLAPSATEGAGGVAGREKPCVVLCGRVHQGETNASWMVKGAIDFLVSTPRQPEAQTLGDSFVFKILLVSLHPARAFETEGPVHRKDPSSGIATEGPVHCYATRQPNRATPTHYPLSDLPPLSIIRPTATIALPVA